MSIPPADTCSCHQQALLLTPLEPQGAACVLAVAETACRDRLLKLHHQQQLGAQAGVLPR